MASAVVVDVDAIVGTRWSPRSFSIIGVDAVLVEERRLERFDTIGIRSTVVAKRHFRWRLHESRVRGDFES